MPGYMYKLRIFPLHLRNNMRLSPFIPSTSLQAFALAREFINGMFIYCFIRVSYYMLVFVMVSANISFGDEGEECEGWL